MAGDQGFGIDPPVVERLTEEVRAVHRMGVALGMVIGGGNIVRGAAASEQGMDRVSADYMGMLATIINALAIQDLLEKKEIETRVMTAIRMDELAEPYIRRRAIRHLEKGRVVIFAAGTGNPYFSTDTAAALRAIEMEAEVVIKATKVPGCVHGGSREGPLGRVHSQRSRSRRSSPVSLRSWTLPPCPSARRTGSRSSSWTWESVDRWLPRSGESALERWFPDDVFR